MLKRKIGRYLLTLLVITGLAGTISDNSVSKAERKYAISQMKDTYKDVVNNTKGLSEAQLNYKTSPDRWSVKECVYHIAASEKMLWMMFEGAMKSPANPEKRAEIKATDEVVMKNVKDRTNKVQTFDPLKPENTGYKTMEEAMADFKMNRMNHIKYMKNTTEDLRNHVVQLPVGWMDCYQLYIFIAGHSNRHTQQLNEVKASPGFPSK